MRQGTLKGKGCDLVATWFLLLFFWWMFSHVLPRVSQLIRFYWATRGQWWGSCLVIKINWQWTIHYPTQAFALYFNHTWMYLCTGMIICVCVCVCVCIYCLLTINKVFHLALDLNPLNHNLKHPPPLCPQLHNACTRTHTHTDIKWHTHKQTHTHTH